MNRYITQFLQEISKATYSAKKSENDSKFDETLRMKIS